MIEINATAETPRKMRQDEKTIPERISPPVSALSAASAVAFEFSRE